MKSCPSVKQPLPSAEGVITVGQGGIGEANRLVNLLRYGALPVAMEIAQSRTIGPTLGEDSIRASIIAGLIGLSVVALFRMLYYRLPGVVAVIALLLYATILLSLFKLLGVVLTLPGIAGFILSVGVAVDANVLIFERLREELRNGRRLSTAVSVGFERAWTSIRDSNISTLMLEMMQGALGNIEESVSCEPTRTQIGFDNSPGRFCLFKAIALDKECAHQGDLEGWLAKG